MGKRRKLKKRNFPIIQIIKNSNYTFITDILFNKKNVFISLIYWFFTIIYFYGSIVFILRQQQITPTIILTLFFGLAFLNLGLYVIYMIFIVFPIEFVNYGVKEIKENVNKLFRDIDLPDNFSLLCDENEINKYIDVDKLPSKATLNLWIYKLKMQTTKLVIISPIAYLIYEVIRYYIVHFTELERIISNVLMAIPPDILNIARLAFSALVITKEIVLINECKARVEFLRDLDCSKNKNVKI